MGRARIDDNRERTLTGVSSVDGETVVEIYGNPSTGAVLIDGTSLYTTLDTRYLKLAADNDPVTGVLTLDVGFVANETGADSDTRIEGDTDANLIYVDASTDRVGIGTASPGYKLHVNGNASFEGNIQMGLTADIVVENDRTVFFGGGSSNGNSFKSGSDGTFLFDIGANNSVKIKGGDALGVEELQYTDTAFSFEWKVNTLGRSTQNGGAVINEEGQDSDTRIEGDTDVNLIFADASADMVGIGTASPTNKLHVAGSGRFTGSYTENTTNSGVHMGIVGGTPRLGFFNATAAQNWQIDNNGGTFRWYLPGVEHMTLTSTRLTANQGFTANETGGDHDTRIEGDTATNLLVVDAGLDAVQIGTTTAGVIADFRNSAIVFNEDAGDRDIRMEGITDANTFYLDAGNNRIGFGTTTPDQKLHVVGNFQVDDADTATKGYRFRTSGSSLDIDFSGTDAFISVYDSAGFTGTQRMKLRFVNGSSEQTKAVKTWQFVDSAFGGTHHQIDGATGGTVVFNEDGHASGDFRVEGDTNANLFFTDASADSIGVGTNAPSSVALIDMQSTTKGFRPPQMTSTERDAITAVAGLVIYNTTTGKLNVYTSAWEAVTSA